MGNLTLDAFSEKKQYKYPYFFLGLYLTFLLLTVCLANRMILIGTVLEPGGILVFPITFAICDVVGEVYGYAYPRLFIWIGIIAEVIFSLILIFVSHLPAPDFFSHVNEYQVVFDPTLRYVGSGLVGLLIGEFANVYLLAKWKVFLKGKFFIFRCLVSTAFGQACLTIVVDLLNYTGKLSTEGLGWLMICGYMWKMCAALLMAFPAWLLVKYLKKIEQVDHYDVNTNFNPFILGLTEKEKSNVFQEANIGSLPR